MKSRDYKKAPRGFTRTQFTLPTQLTRASYDVLVARQLLDTYGPARVELVGGDADLGAHAELSAVGELCRCIVQHDGTIDAREETLGGGGIAGDDGLGVCRSVLADVRDGALDAIHDPGRDDRVEVFRVPVF